MTGGSGGGIDDGRGGGGGGGSAYSWKCGDKGGRAVTLGTPCWLDGKYSVGYNFDLDGA